MALTARVTNMNGQIVAEKRDGQHRVLTSDPQGNVIKVSDASGATLATYNYWPYRGIRTSTGSIDTNPWRYGGTWGYFYDGASYYIRARVYRPNLTRWMTVDPLWPDELPFAYASSNPTSFTDPSGHEPCKACRSGSPNRGCGDKPSLGPCGLNLCALRCSMYGTSVIGEGKRVQISFLCFTYNTCCCPCLCKCSDLENGGACYEANLEDCAKNLVAEEIKKRNFTVGPPHKNNGAKVDRACGFCSKGTHYMYYCLGSTGKNTNAVASATCCECSEGGRKEYRCKVKRCHTKKGKFI